MSIKSIPVATTRLGKTKLIMIDGAITIYEVSELQVELLEYLKKDKNILLDLSKVESCDSAGVQLICSFVKEVELQGGTIVLEAYSDAVLNICNKIGIDIAALFIERKE